MRPATDGRLTPHSPRQLDRLFGVLSDEYRRQALGYLAEVGRPAPPAELAAAVTSRTRGDVRDADTVPLHHVHLPKLTAAALVEADPRGVRLTPLAERVLDSLPEELSPTVRPVPTVGSRPHRSQGERLHDRTRRRASG